MARGHAPSGRATMTPMRRKRVSQKGTLPLQAVSNRCPCGLRLRRQPRQLRLQRKGKSVKEVGSVFTIAPAKSTSVDALLDGPGERLGAPVTHRLSKQAKQRTASRSAIYLLRVSDPIFGCVESCSALAVGDLVSRQVPHHYPRCLDRGVVNVRGAQAP